MHRPQLKRPNWPTLRAFMSKLCWVVLMAQTTRLPQSTAATMARMTLTSATLPGTQTFQQRQKSRQSWVPTPDLEGLRTTVRLGGSTLASDKKSQSEYNLTGNPSLSKKVKLEPVHLIHLITS